MQNRNRNRIPLKPLYGVSVLLLLGLLYSCGLPQAPGRKGLLSITLPGSREEARAIKLPGDVDLNRMIYKLKLSGPGGSLNLTAQQGASVTIEIEPGRWHIAVDAFYLRPGVLEMLIEGKVPQEEWFNFEYAVPAGTGSAEADVFAGRQNQIRIPLFVLDEFAAVDLDISLDFAKIINGAPELEDGSIVIHRSSANGNTTKTLTVTDPAEYTVIEWYYDNTLLNEPATPEFQPSLILDSSDIRYNAIRMHYLTVEVVKDGSLYTRTITFEVAP